MSKLKQFATDSKTIKDGRWHEVGGMSFLLAYRGDLNPRFPRAIEQHRRPLQYQFANDVLTDEQREQFELDVFVDSILLDWKGVDELEFNRENALTVLREYPHLFGILRNLAGDIGLYRPGNPESDAKNS